MRLTPLTRSRLGWGCGASWLFGLEPPASAALVPRAAPSPATSTSILDAAGIEEQRLGTASRSGTEANAAMVADTAAGFAPRARLPPREANRSSGSLGLGCRLPAASPNQ